MIVCLFTLFRKSACAGVFNSVNGDKIGHVKLYTTFIMPPQTQGWGVGFYAGTPSIVSRSCTKNGVFPGKDGGMVCNDCKTLREKKGGSNPGTSLNKWRTNLSRVLDLKQRTSLTVIDMEDAINFTKSSDKSFTPFGLQLLQETKNLVNYYNYMCSLRSKTAPPSDQLTFEYVNSDSVPGVDDLFKNAAELYKKKPSF